MISWNSESLCLPCKGVAKSSCDCNLYSCNVIVSIMETRINSTKIQKEVKLCDYEALSQLLATENERLKNRSDDQSATKTTRVSENEKSSNTAAQTDKWSWRNMPDVIMEEMIISSYGSEHPESVNVAMKLTDNTVEEKDKLLMARKELDIIQEKFHSHKTSLLKYFCVDFPGAQFSRDYYLDRIKTFFKLNKSDGGIYMLILKLCSLVNACFFFFIACLWYIGHSEKNTGNWCLKDGVITFDDIFALYMDYFKGKRLTVVCDCSYSGQWVLDSVKKMDKIGIPSCGHHAREQGILLKVFASCQANEEASILLFLEAVTVNDKKLLLPGNNKLESGQTPLYGDFRSIRCRKKANEPCEIGSSSTWNNRIAIGMKNIYIVRGEDQGKPAWHYVLVDEEKVDSFKAQIATGSIDVAKFGRVISSGWGKDPPKEKKDMIDAMFADFIHSE